MSANGNLVLDTNILVHAVRDDMTGQYIKQQYGLLVREPVPFICVVSDGELRSLAKQFSWGRRNTTQAFFFLNYFARLTLESPRVLDDYALIDQFSKQKGIKMGKNDLWIAATAKAFDVTLLTTDADFDHLPQDFVRHERVLLRSAS